MLRVTAILRLTALSLDRPVVLRGTLGAHVGTTRIIPAGLRPQAASAVRLAALLDLETVMYVVDTLASEREDDRAAYWVRLDELRDRARVVDPSEPIEPLVRRPN